MRASSSARPCRSDLPNVVADQRSMRQIMLNILSNAIKFTDPGGQVIISAHMNKSGELKLRVKDTGIGMNDEQLRDALEPFKRVVDRGPRGAGNGPWTAAHQGAGGSQPHQIRAFRASRARERSSSLPSRQRASWRNSRQAGWQRYPHARSPGPHRPRLWLMLGACLIALLVTLPILTIVLLSFTSEENIWPHLLGTVLPGYVWRTLGLLAGVGLLTFIIGTATAWLVSHA